MFSETGKRGPWMAERTWARALVRNTRPARLEKPHQSAFTLFVMGKCLLNI